MEIQKLMKIIAVSVLFFIVASPCTYCLVNSLTGLVLDKKGCPTYLGVLIHSVVFGLLLYALCSLMENKEHFYHNYHNWDPEQPDPDPDLDPEPDPDDWKKYECPEGYELRDDNLCYCMDPNGSGCNIR